MNTSCALKFHPWSQKDPCQGQADLTAQAQTRALRAGGGEDRLPPGSHLTAGTCMKPAPAPDTPQGRVRYVSGKLGNKRAGGSWRMGAPKENQTCANLRRATAGSVQNQLSLPIRFQYSNQLPAPTALLQACFQPPVARSARVPGACGVSDSFGRRQRSVFHPWPGRHIRTRAVLPFTTVQLMPVSFKFCH